MKRSTKPQLTKSGRARGVTNIGLTTDPSFNWLNLRVVSSGGRDGDMEQWRVLAAEYIAHISATGERAIAKAMTSLRMFLEHYLLRHRLLLPDSYFSISKGASMPPLMGPVGETPFRPGKTGTAFSNHTYDFLQWVFQKKYCSDEDGHLVAMPGFRIPFKRFEASRSAALDESVRTPLPFSMIRELRAMLAPGAHFSDWKWAQMSSGKSTGEKAGDWFVVDESVIDESDPDCVWRSREVSIRNYMLPTPDHNRLPTAEVGRRTIHEIWSPVVAVALLAKMEMPWRTYQTRMLDSGEMDISCVELVEEGGGATKWKFIWSENSDRKALLSGLAPTDRARVGGAQGVFLRCHDSRIGDYVGFFVNTNKTADADKEWSHRGYRTEWQHDSLHRWLIKLRNWQQKYNPIDRPTLWTELEVRHYAFPRSDVELQGASPTCFLFRDAASRLKQTRNDERKPITMIRIEGMWVKLLAAYEDKLAVAGVRDASGQALKFLKLRRKNLSVSTPYFPLHALRVSLITAFADGGMGLEVLMRLAGHTRLVMTIYYRKLNTWQLNSAMKQAQESLAARADALTIEWLKGKSYTDLPNYVAVDNDSLRAALPSDPLMRNAAGWERQLGGWCLMGGNTVPTSSDDKRCGGCFDGGSPIREAKSKSHRVHGPVRPKACIEENCRWFVSRPEYILEIKAKMDLLATNYGAAQRKFEETEAQRVTLEREKLRIERVKHENEKSGNGAASPVFDRHDEYNRLLRISDKAATDRDYLLRAIGNCARLVDRVLALAISGESDTPGGGLTKLVAQGQEADLKWAFTDVDNELLQLSGVCLNAEVFPELETESEPAAVRRGQLLDLALQKGGQPLVFAKLSPDQQLRLGNRFTHELAKAFNGDWGAAISGLLEGTSGVLANTALTHALGDSNALPAGHPPPALK
jgi:hypothetical protein